MEASFPMVRPVRLAVCFGLVACWLFIGGCGSRDGQSAPTASVPGDSNAAQSGDSGDSGKPPSDRLHPIAVIHSSLGDITLKLDAEHAPITVENFLNYVEQGHYDSTIIHQIQAKPAVIVGGGFDTFQKEKPAGLPIRNEAHNGLKNVRGAIGMARRPDMIDSSTCQFYINVADNPQLDHKAAGAVNRLESRPKTGPNSSLAPAADEAAAYGYCVFGEVTAGMDVVDRIANLSVHDVSSELTGVPVEQVVVKWIHVAR
jgi:cyclophilin family peptidyl-prolyl cis-trans isomerase